MSAAGDAPPAWAPDQGAGDGPVDVGVPGRSLLSRLGDLSTVTRLAVAIVIGLQVGRLASSWGWLGFTAVLVVFAFVPRVDGLSIAVLTSGVVVGVAGQLLVPGWGELLWAGWMLTVGTGAELWRIRSRPGTVSGLLGPRWWPR